MMLTFLIELLINVMLLVISVPFPCTAQHHILLHVTSNKCPPENSENVINFRLWSIS